MNLWIRSQDKKEFRPNPKFGIDMVENDCYIVDRYSFDDGIILGKYSTKERALEVLDEIQSLLIERVNFCEFIIDNKFTSRVYEMPKE